VGEEGLTSPARRTIRRSRWRRFVRQLCFDRSARLDAPGLTPDQRVAMTLTQLLLDSGSHDAAGTIVVATWRRGEFLAFEVICAERVRSPLGVLLSRVLARDFLPGPWVLSPAEADRIASFDC
jgi:hypothetical protein